MTHHAEEIKDKFNEHVKKENEYVLARDKRELDFTQEIEKLRINGAKSYAELKISMETEIQNLEKCFEDMKAL